MADNHSSNRPPEDLTLDDLSSEEMEMVKNWDLPDVEDDKSASDKTTALGRSVDWYYHRKQRDAETAEHQSEDIKPLTADEIEQIRQSAYEEGLLQGNNDGFEKGYNEGLEKGHIEGIQKGTEQGIQTGIEQGAHIIEGQALRWQNLTEQLSNPLHELNERVEKQLVALAVMLAEAVINVEVKTNQAVIFNTLKESIEALPFSENECEISLNPLDLALVKAQFTEQDLMDKGWHLKSEPVIEQGGCIVQSRTSIIDQSLKERIKATLGKFEVDAGLNDKSDNE